MKNLLISCLCYFGLNISNFAQPVVNYSATHAIGTQAKMYLIGGSTAALSQIGANATWNLSTNTCTRFGTFDAVNPQTTPYTTSYPAANLAYVSDATITNQGISYTYFIDSPTLEQKMAEAVGSPFQVIYTDYQETMKYPLAFNESFNGTSQIIGGSSINFTSTYDGYGTLIINSHTYKDVVHISSTTGDVTLIMTTPVLYPLIFISGGNYFYIEPTISTNISTIQIDNNISIYPNPASNVVTIKPNKEIIDGSLNVLDAVGRVVFSEKIGSFTITLHTEKWNNGIYFIEIKSKEFYQKQKLLIQH